MVLKQQTARKTRHKYVGLKISSDLISVFKGGLFFNQLESIRVHEKWKVEFSKREESKSYQDHSFILKHGFSN